MFVYIVGMLCVCVVDGEYVDMCYYGIVDVMVMMMVMMLCRRCLSILRMMLCCM